ncbi:MAG: hypothetical protein WCS77_09915 [Elusimicrobiaceae bacterium]
MPLSLFQKTSKNPDAAQKHAANPSRLSNAELFIIACNFLMLGLFSQFKLSSDSASYLQHSMLRSPGYPLLLDVLTKVFPDLAYAATVILQTSAVMCAAFFLSKVLKKHFNLPDPLFVFCDMLLLSPVASGRAALIGPEAFMYAAVLTAAGFIIKDIFEETQHNFSRAVSITFIGCLMKPQTAFMYPVIALFAFIRARETRTWKKLAGTLSAILVAVCLTGISERAYNLHFNKNFTDCGFGHFHMFATLAHFAGPEDVAALSLPEDKYVMQKVLDYIGKPDMSAKYDEDIYSPLLWHSLSTFMPDAEKQNPQEARYRERIFVSRVWPKLMKNHAPEFFKFVAGKFVLGLSYGYYLFFVAGLWIIAKSKDGKLRKFMLLGIAMAVMNHLIISMLTVVRDRYSFATTVLFSPFILIAVWRTSAHD